jgi:DNA-binding transcriptional regulator YhcF (GntR family)
MARFTGGWIKLWRKSVEGDLADNMFLWGLWNWLLFAATWKPSSIIWKGKRRDIPPGTVVMGISELAEKWDCSSNTIRKWLNYLVESQRITLEVCTRGTLVTICNWSVYQATDSESCAPSENQVITDCKPSENQVTLNEEVKKLRREETKEKDVKFSLNEENINRSYTAWENLLIHFRMGRAVLESEKRPLLQAIQRHGINAVEMCFRGAAKEKRSETFDPSNFVKLQRYLGPENFERFINLGVKAFHEDRNAS